MIIIPIGTQSSLALKPKVTLGLIAVNVLAFFATLSVDYSTLGLIPARMDRLYTFITYMFMHAGIFHLLGNMIFLWVVGSLLEDSWGRIHFLVFYLVGGVAAGLAHCLHDTSSTLPLVGASGAIAATMGAFTVRHFMTKIKFFYLFILFIKPFWGTFYLPAFVFLPFWFFEQVLFMYIAGKSGVSHVAYMAHIGGYIAGLTYAALLHILGIEERIINPYLAKKQIEAGVLRDQRFTDACDLLNSGRTAEARARFMKLASEHLDDENMINDIAVVFKENGMLSEYRDMVDRSLRALLIKGKYEEASQMTFEYMKSGNGEHLERSILMRLARWLEEREMYGEAYDLYTDVINGGKEDINLVSKAYMHTAKLLAMKMNNLRDALKICAEWRSLPLDKEWLMKVEETEEQISSTVLAD